MLYSSPSLQNLTFRIYASDKPSHGVLPLTNSSYLLIYPNVDAFATQQGGPLFAQLVTISPSSGSISLSSSATLGDSQANYFFATARLHDSRGVVVFVDAAQNNALIAASIEITNLASMVFYSFYSQFIFFHV